MDNIFTTNQLVGKKFNGLTIKDAKLIGNLSGIVLIFEDLPEKQNIAAHVLTISEAINMCKVENHNG